MNHVRVAFTLVFSFAAITSFAADEIKLIQGEGMDGWKKPTNKWMNVGEVSKSAENEKQLTSKPGSGVIVNGPDGRTPDILSEAEFGDVEVHCEWMVAKGSNSGVYLMGRYEVQILDSFGVKEPHYSDAGGLYQRWDEKRGKGNEGFEGHAPKTNPAKAPGEWQSFDIVFRAPRFGADGKKTENAKFIKVVFNGEVIHENVELNAPTRGGIEPEVPVGPIRLQGDHGPVAFRNFTVKKVDLSK